MQQVNIGDKVRFLNDIGGGIVKRVDGKILYVEDEDGFQIPTINTECVLVEKAASSHPTSKTQTLVPSAKQANQHLFIAVENLESKLKRPLFQFWLVNQTVFDANFVFLRVQSQTNQYLLSGEVKKQQKVDLGQYSIQQIDEYKFQIQAIFFNRDERYEPMPLIDAPLVYKPASFLKADNFIKTDGFDFSIFKINIWTNSIQPKEIFLKDQIVAKPAIVNTSNVKKTGKNEPLEIDLHIHNILDSYDKLSNHEMLQVQIARFEEVMTQNIGKKGTRVVFIHGVGNGVLKQEVIKILKQKYKSIYYQDASFKEYGYGATMVIF